MCRTWNDVNLPKQHRSLRDSLGSNTLKDFTRKHICVYIDNTEVESNIE